jgi:hypothetical protein
MAELADRPPSRLLTSLRMQAIEYSHRRLLLLIVLAMPVVFFAATYYTAPESGRLVPMLVPERTGTAEVWLSPRLTWPMSVGIMGVAWAVGTIGFFAVMGNLQRDRRLVLSGYAAWEILVARLAILAVISVPLALVGMVPYTVITHSNNPELVLLANFLAGLIAAGFGLVIGTLLPRPTEGMLIVLLVIGIGMSLDGEALKYFFLYPPIQLLVVGRLAEDPWPYPYIWQSLAVVAAFLVPSLFLWWRRTRILA